MAIVVTANSLKQVIDSATPGQLSSAVQVMKGGSWMRSMPTRLYRKEAAAYAYVVGTSEAIALPDDAKAAFVMGAYNRAGSVTGYMTPDEKPSGTTVSSGHIGVTPSGDLQFLAGDDVDDVDVTYLPAAYDIVELILPVASNSMTIPAAYAAAPLGVLFMMEAESLTGTLVSKLVVGASASSNTTTGSACLDVAQSHVLFDSADAVTSARVKLAIVPGTDPNELLEAVSPVL